MKKINTKTIVVFIVLLVVIVLTVLAITKVKTFMSGATSDVEPTNVTAISTADGKGATISWVAEKESVAKVEYGTTAASLVLMAAESTPTLNHNLSLTSLRPSTVYYYRIRIGEEIFDNSGVPYSFKTKGESEVALVATPTLAVSGSVCDSKTDYNKDGMVNTLDLMTCRKTGGVVPTMSVVKPVTTVTPTTTKAVTTPAVDCSNIIADYNSDGVINSLDRLNCLQSTR